MPHDDGATVEITRSIPAPPLRLKFASVADARSVVASLGFDATRARDRFRPASALARSIGFHLALQFALQFGLHATGPAVVAFVALLLAVLFVDERLRSLEIGPDGVFIKSLFGATHIATSQLRRVQRVNEDRSYRELAFVTDQRLVRVWVPATEVAAIENRVLELSAARDRGSGAEDARMLEGRMTAELRELGSRAATFRSEGIDRATLLRIVEDVAVAPALRARAAVALADADPEVRTRIAHAAASSTFPELRIALARSADDDVDIALADLDRAVERYAS
jgi:hypothetical protein